MAKFNVPIVTHEDDETECEMQALFTIFISSFANKYLEHQNLSENELNYILNRLEV